MTDSAGKVKGGGVRRVLAAVGLAAVLVGAPTTVAVAAVLSVGATGNSYNQTIYYGTPRWHGGGSGTSFRLDSHTYFCGSSFQIALRGHGSGDSTYYNYYQNLGGTQGFKWWNGSLNVPADSYYITARNNCAGGSDLGYYNWAGALTLNQ